MRPGRGPVPTTPLTAAARHRVDWMLEDLRALVERESPSADTAALAASADAVRELIARRLDARAEVVVRDGVSHVRHGPAAPRVLLLGHHDTVWPVGTLARIPFGVLRGTVRGPGCFDMKAGLVMAVHALALLRDLGDHRAAEEAALLVTGDEECGSATSRPLIEREARTAEAVLVLEASADGGAAKVARKGTALYRIEVTGRAAHAGLEPERGVNATTALARVALAAGDLGDPAVRTTVTPTRMEAGTTANTVPDRGCLQVDVRAWTDAELHRVDAALRQLTTGVRGAELAVTGGPDRPALEPARSAELFERWRRVAADHGIAVPAGAHVGGASDGNITAGLGVPTLDGLGAVGGGAHAVTEHVVVEQLAPRTAVLAALIEDLARRPIGRPGLS